MTLETHLRTLPGRCQGCGFHLERQSCACPGKAAATDAMAATLATRPNESRAVESAIRELASAGKPFSANDARTIHGVRGGVVGATFNALRQEGVIRPVGAEASTEKNTHSKPVALWVGVAA